MAHNNRGTTLNNLKRPKEALASFHRAIELEPDFAEAHNNRGNALLGLKRDADALASFEHAISQLPYNAHTTASNAL
jgi:tetratricopeptide (TPR) repeat protein